MDFDRAQELLDAVNKYRDMEEYANAEQRLKELIEGIPEAPTFWTLLGDTLSEQNKWEDSEAAFLKALELKANHLSAILGLGNMFCEKGESERAEQCFNYAIEVDPNSKLAHECLEDFKRFGKLTK